MSAPAADCAAIERALGPGLVRTRATTFVRGRGARLYDADGAEYLDCAAAHGAASLGHAHPAVLEALAQQAGRLLSCTPSFANDVRAAYLSELVEVLPGDLGRVFLCNSGAEAVEAALKFARAATGRPKIVACMRGFHGRTLGALSATWERRYREAFEPLVPGFVHVPYSNVEALEEAVDQKTACVVLEPVQGEGGVRVPPPGYLAEVERVCRRSGALLVVDEVQTGFGRTGKLFAVQHGGTTPDLLCLGKGIAAGLPMGAMAFGPRVGELPLGSHGSTFGGSPLTCAVARATLRTILGEGLPERAERLGASLRERVAELRAPVVREVRGLGLMVGIELRVEVQPVLEELLERRVVALAAGRNVLRLLPPLIVGREEVDELVGHLRAVLAARRVPARGRARRGGEGVRR